MLIFGDFPERVAEAIAPDRYDFETQMTEVENARQVASLETFSRIPLDTSPQ